MKIVLTFDEMDPVAEEFLIEWIEEKVSDKSAENVSPLRYVRTMEIEGRSLEVCNEDAERGH